MEIWKDINGYEGLYQISNLGNVKTLRRNKLMKPCPSGGGYLGVTLIKNSKQVNKTVHRLVALHFVENPQDYKCVNHKDENKFNNKADNLEWCTYQYNNTYGTFQLRKAKSRYIKVSQYDMNNNLINVYDSISIAGIETNTNSKNISSCCKGIRKSVNGYKWRYYEK